MHDFAPPADSQPRHRRPTNPSQEVAPPRAVRRTSTAPILAPSRPLLRGPAFSKREPREQPVSMAYSVVRSFLKGDRSQVSFPLTVDPAAHRREAESFLVIDRGGARYGKVRCPFGTIGDRLWVRERWSPGHAPFDKEGTVYEADRPAGWHRWRAPSTLPREASRVLLTITGLEVRRLQSVSDDDVRREDTMGWLLDTVERWPHARNVLLDEWRRYTMVTTPYAEIPSLRGLYAKNWDTRLGPGFLDWFHDPLVWVIRFDVDRIRATG